MILALAREEGRFPVDAVTAASFDKKASERQVFPIQPFTRARLAEEESVSAEGSERSGRIGDKSLLE